MEYALIENGVVVNVIVLLPQNAHEFPNAVKMEVPAGIGDEYHDEKFWRDGVEIVTYEETRIQSLELENSEIVNMLGEATEMEYNQAIKEIERL